MALVRQRFDPAEVAEAGQAVRRELAESGLDLRPGQDVAVAVGSRGIDRLAEVVAAVCAHVREAGGTPYLVPAMGSHGGATAEGQARVLAGLGVTPRAMGAALLPSMETRPLGETDDGAPVFCAAQALACDHIVAVNRIKAHTKFKAPVESGLMKMLAVGLGKHEGAVALHRHAVRLGMYPALVGMARLVLARAPVTLGLALVENAHGRLCRVEAVPPATMEAREEALLREAKARAAKLPFADLDLLVVDAIGKDVSGTGMDTNVTGRNRDILGDFAAHADLPRIKRILVLGLTAATGGNALGLGFADVTTQRAVQAMDPALTATNALTGLSPEKAAVPLALPTDRLALSAALHTLGPWNPDTVRLCRIADTARLERLLVSPALLAELPPHLTRERPPEAWPFDDKGELPPFPTMA